MDGRTDRRTELRWLRRAIAVPPVARKNWDNCNKRTTYCKNAFRYKLKYFSIIIKFIVYYSDHSCAYLIKHLKCDCNSLLPQTALITVSMQESHMCKLRRLFQSAKLFCMTFKNISCQNEILQKNVRKRHNYMPHVITKWQIIHLKYFMLWLSLLAFLGQQNLVCSGQNFLWFFPLSLL